MGEIRKFEYSSLTDPYLEEESSQKEDFYIYLARETEVFSDWNTVVRTFPHYRLYYIIDSKNAFIKLKNMDIELKAGNVYYIPANMIEGGCCEMLNHIYIHFIPNLQVKKILDKCNKVFTYKSTDDEKLFRIIMENSVKSGIDSDYIINGAMYLLLGRIISLNREEENSEKGKFKKVVEYIEKRISHSFSLEELAIIMDYDKEYFSHSFKRAFGVPPMQYINNKKIALSCKMLSRFDVPLGEIAKNLGFSSEYYFSRLFKIKTGMNPTEYREYTHRNKIMQNA